MAKAKTVIYRIKVKNWEKYNANRKKSYKCVLISHRFLDDAKIASVSPVTRLLFLSCVLLTGESGGSHIEVTRKSLAGQSGVKCESVEGQLTLLQSLQLLTFEKLPVLLERNRIEENRIERNGVSEPEKPKKEKPAPAKPSPPANTLIAFYCDTWKARYGSNPPITQPVAGMIKKFLQEHGELKGRELITAYLKMPDQWFVTKRHDFATLLTNLNAVSHFAASGKMISRRETNQLDLAVSAHNTVEAIRRGEV